MYLILIGKFIEIKICKWFGDYLQVIDLIDF